MNLLKKQTDQLLREKYNGIDSQSFRVDAARLGAGEPYEYVLGHTDFLGAKIDLRHKPMIPRFETAFWVKKAIAELKRKKKPLRIADTFSGSGNVGVAVLKHVPDSFVEFSECDPGLLEQIRTNCELNAISERRYRITHGDGLSSLSGTYDAIFAVPPYVAREAMNDLDPEMIQFEPHLAFFAGDNGTAYHRMLVAEAHKFLGVGGTLYMEADMDQDAIIRELVSEAEWKKLLLWKDPYGATPNVVLRK